MNSYVSTYDPSRAQELAEELTERTGIEVKAVQVTVYKSNKSGKKRFSRLSAYKDAAWCAWKETHYPVCMCRREEPQRDREDFFCADHGSELESNERHIRAAHRQLVICRLARWLMWRDGWKIPKALKKDIVIARHHIADVLCSQDSR